MTSHWRKRARRYGARGSHSLRQWRELKARFGHRCLGCGVAEPVVVLTRDHVTPLIAGGRDSVDNLQPLCEACNGEKGCSFRELRPERLLCSASTSSHTTTSTP
jgi:5-methylcytosine-specific restriction endonuclease McrA